MISCSSSPLASSNPRATTNPTRTSRQSPLFARILPSSDNSHRRTNLQISYLDRRNTNTNWNFRRISPKQFIRKETFSSTLFSKTIMEASSKIVILFIIKQIFLIYASLWQMITATGLAWTGSVTPCSREKLKSNSTTEKPSSIKYTPKTSAVRSQTAGWTSSYTPSLRF